MIDRLVDFFPSRLSAGQISVREHINQGVTFSVVIC